MVLQGGFFFSSLSVFLPRNSKNLCTEHYTPIRTLQHTRSWRVHIAPHSPSTTPGTGNAAPGPHPQLGTKLRQHLFILWLEVCLGRAGPQRPGASAYTGSSPLLVGAEAVERHQVAVQVPAPPSTCMPEPWACSAPLGCPGTPGNALLAALRHPFGCSSTQPVPSPLIWTVLPLCWS